MLDTRKNILITGGTGSLGSALVARWHQNHNITVLSRDWLKQARMKRLYPGVTFTLADICDRDAVSRACIGQDILVHCAALKDVRAGEENPGEYIRVNIEGSKVVSSAWKMTTPYILEQIGYSNRPALYINSDKACSPLNHYGVTKKAGESLFINAGFSSIRYGNVISSNGSFLQVWKSRIESGQPIIARTPTPTRFALSLDQAVDLVQDALSQPPGIYIPHGLPAFLLADVVDVFKRRYDCKVHYEELLQGEKRHEILLAEGELAERMSDLLARVVYTYEPDKRMEQFRFNSKTAPRLGREEIEAWL